jgi:hypothetical protein
MHGRLPLLHVTADVLLASYSFTMRQMVLTYLLPVSLSFVYPSFKEHIQQAPTITSCATRPTLSSSPLVYVVFSLYSEAVKRRQYLVGGIFYGASGVIFFHEYLITNSKKYFVMGPGVLDTLL